MKKEIIVDTLNQKIFVTDDVGEEEFSVADKIDRNDFPEKAEQFMKIKSVLLTHRHIISGDVNDYEILWK